MNCAKDNVPLIRRLYMTEVCLCKCGWLFMERGAIRCERYNSELIVSGNHEVAISCYEYTANLRLIEEDKENERINNVDKGVNIKFNKEEAK